MTSKHEDLKNQIEAARDELNNFIENINNLNSTERHELLELSRKMDELLNKYLKISQS